MPPVVCPKCRRVRSSTQLCCPHCLYGLFPNVKVAGQAGVIVAGLVVLFGALLIFGHGDTKKQSPGQIVADLARHLEPGTQRAEVLNTLGPPRSENEGVMYYSFADGWGLVVRFDRYGLADAYTLHNGALDHSQGP